MYQKGALVLHPDYGVGTFHDVMDVGARFAVVRFRDRGERRIILPSQRLRALHPAVNRRAPAARPPFIPQDRERSS